MVSTNLSLEQDHLDSMRQQNLTTLVRADEELQSRPRAFMYCRRKYAIKRSFESKDLRGRLFYHVDVLLKPSHDFF